MVAKQQMMDELVDRIVRTLDPERVVLFGSHGRGEGRPESDFDVLVIKESDEPRYQRSVPLYKALADWPAEVDVLVYTPHEVEEWSEVPEAFVTTALREGRVLYERQN